MVSPAALALVRICFASASVTTNRIISPRLWLALTFGLHPAASAGMAAQQPVRQLLITAEVRHNGDVRAQVHLFGQKLRAIRNARQTQCEFLMASGLRRSADAFQAPIAMPRTVNQGR